MKKSTILLVSLFTVSLAGTAGNAVDPSKCKKLQVKKSSMYALDVVYKDCLTGQTKTERMAAANDERNLLLDPSINSETELKINEVAGLHNPIWKAQTAGNGWVVKCDGSVISPECRGTPMGGNCNTLTMNNGGAYWAGLTYIECGTKNSKYSELGEGENLTYSVEPNTGIHVDMVGGDGKIWPRNLKEIIINSNYEVTCGGYWPNSHGWCKGKSVTK